MTEISSILLMVMLSTVNGGVSDDNPVVDGVNVTTFTWDF